MISESDSTPESFLKYVCVNICIIYIYMCVCITWGDLRSIRLDLADLFCMISLTTSLAIGTTSRVVEAFFMNLQPELEIVEG